MKGVYLFADLVVEVECVYEYTSKFLEPFDVKYFGVTRQTDFSVSVTEEETREEFEKYKEFPEFFYENLCVLKKINDKLVTGYDGFLFHASVVEVGGKAYAFSAKSGTGKSTHTALLKELLKDDLKYINDDKPFIRYNREEGKIYAYGNPWRGKEHRGTRRKAELGGVCMLARGKENSIEQIPPTEAVARFLAQIQFPTEEKEVPKLLETVDNVLSKVPFYSMRCNKDISAAETSFNRMMKK